MTRSYDRITPLLAPLHWLEAPEQIEFKLAILAGVQMSAPDGSVVIPR